MEEFFGVATDGMDEVLTFTATAAAAVIGIALAIKGALYAKRFAAMSGPGGYDKYAADYAEWLTTGKCRGWKTKSGFTRTTRRSRNTSSKINVT